MSSRAADAKALIATVNKKLGRDALVLGSQMPEEIRRITTGSLAFDAMLGGGWPVNQWNEVIGPESSGKTALCLKTVAANQALDPNFWCLWIAAEGYVHEYAEACGVDNDRMFIAHINVMEEAYETVITALDNRSADLIVIDSLPALVPIDEDDKTMTDFQVGLGARLTGKFMRKSSNAQRRSLTDKDRDCTCLIINQWREKIGTMYGDPRTTPGGVAKNYFCYTRVEVKRDDWIEGTRKGHRVGMTMMANTIKNKSAPPRRSGSVDFYFADHGPFHLGDFDTMKEIVNLSLAQEIITRRGAYFEFNGERWQGRDAVLAAVRESPDLQEQLRCAVLGIEPPPKKVVPAKRAAKATTAPAAKRTVRRVQR